MPPLVMGVLNVTPDSFSDGGRYLDRSAAVARGLEMIEEGAAVIDVGGESTRPGAAPVEPAVERERVIAVVRALVPYARISIDTRHAEVARAAVEAGATLINDISASLWEVAAAAQVGYVAVHMQGGPATMQRAPHYDDVLSEVRAFLRSRAQRALDAGVEEIWVDPGIGFGKTVEHNLALLASLRMIASDGHPVLVGASRKRFIASVLDHDAALSPPDDRLEGSLATAVWALEQGAAMVRVHDVAATVQAARLVGDAPLALAGGRRGH